MPFRRPSGGLDLSSSTEVTLVACAKNEGAYLLEWIAHHRLLGFARIVVYDNESDDSSRRLLSSLAALGAIEFRRQYDRPQRGPQFYAYTDAIVRCRTEWIMFLDLDEFLALDEGTTIGRFLERFGPEVVQVGFNWRVFGSSHRKEPGEGLVIERFRLASTAAAGVNHHLKSVTRRAAIALPDVHAPYTVGGAVVHPDGTPIRTGLAHGLSAELRWEGGAVHHYAVKSESEFMGKIARGRGTIAAGSPKKMRADPERLFRSHDLNDEPCDTLAGRAGPVRAEMERLAAALARAERSPLFRLRRDVLGRLAGAGQRRRVPDGGLVLKPGFVKPAPAPRGKAAQPAPARRPGPPA